MNLPIFFTISPFILGLGDTSRYVDDITMIRSVAVKKYRTKSFEGVVDLTRCSG